MEKQVKRQQDQIHQAGFSGPDICKISGPWKRLRTFWRCPRYRGPDFWPEFPGGRIFRGGRIIRPSLTPDNPALVCPNGWILVGGINTPLLPPPQAAQSLQEFITIRATSRNTRITRSPPPTIQSSWSLENRRRRPRSTSSPKRFAFPPHMLEGPLASVPILESLVVCCWCVLVNCCVVTDLGASNLVVDVCPKNLVKARFPPRGNPLVEVG